MLAHASSAPRADATAALVAALATAAEPAAALAQPAVAKSATALALAAAAIAIALAAAAVGPTDRAAIPSIAAARPFCGRAVHRKYPRRPLQGHAQDQGAPSAPTHAYMPTHQCAPDGHTEKC